jgi:hypothetical protein
LKSRQYNTGRFPAPAIRTRAGGATEKRVRKHCDIDEQRLDRGDRARPHAAPGRGVERASTKILNGRETQGIDRRLGENQSWEKRTLQRQSEERLSGAILA